MKRGITVYVEDTITASIVDVEECYFEMFKPCGLGFDYAEQNRIRNMDAF